MKTTELRDITPIERRIGQLAFFAVVVVLFVTIHYVAVSHVPLYPKGYISVQVFPWVLTYVIFATFILRVWRHDRSITRCVSFAVVSLAVAPILWQLEIYAFMIAQAMLVSR